MQDTASVMCCECHWRYPTQSWAMLWGQPYSVDMLRLLSFSALPHIWINKCSSHWVVAAAHFILSCRCEQLWTTTPIFDVVHDFWWFLMIFDHFPPCISKTVPYVFLYFRMIFACFFPHPLRFKVLAEPPGSCASRVLCAALVLWCGSA